LLANAAVVKACRRPPVLIEALQVEDPAPVAMARTGQRTLRATGVAATVQSGFGRDGDFATLPDGRIRTMTSGKRPGGLTALAVFNFVFGAMGVLSALGMVVFIPMLGRLPEEAMADFTAEQLAQLEALQEVGAGLFVTLAVLGLVSALLLIVSGIGYLGLRKFLGRTLGNVYGILGIVATVGSAMFMPVVLGGGSFTIGTILGLIYPVLTLVLLNTAFKEDFVN
jgi:hypothetical protein